MMQHYLSRVFLHPRNNFLISDVNLYWLSTPDGFENWFVYATTNRLAERFHENAEGYNRNYAVATLVCVIPDEQVEKFSLEKRPQDWPSHELLIALGGKIESELNPRIVNINGTVYKEGNFTEGMLLQDKLNGSGVYIVVVQGTEKYKIGRTKNLTRRLKALKIGNPYNLKIVYFIETEHYKSLEKHLHKVFCNYRIEGEWFNFDPITIKELEVNLALLQQAPNNIFRVYDVKQLSIHGRQY